MFDVETKLYSIWLDEEQGGAGGGWGNFGGLDDKRIRQVFVRKVTQTFQQNKNEPLNISFQ